MLIQAHASDAVPSRTLTPSPTNSQSLKKCNCHGNWFWLSSLFFTSVIILSHVPKILKSFLLSPRFKLHLFIDYAFFFASWHHQKRSLIFLLYCWRSVWFLYVETRRIYCRRVSCGCCVFVLCCAFLILLPWHVASELLHAMWSWASQTRIWPTLASCCMPDPGYWQKKNTAAATTTTWQKQQQPQPHGMVQWTCCTFEALFSETAQYPDEVRHNP